MSLRRHAGGYLLAGGLQWLLDWGVMVGLSHAGVPVFAANLAGRVCGALLGFWLNGRFTFAGEGHAIGRRQFARFAFTWLVTTCLGTWAVARVDAAFGLHRAWLAKPAIDVVLAVAGFLLSRHWIYRRHPD